MKIVEMRNKDNEKVLPDFITDDLTSNSHIEIPSVYGVNQLIKNTYMKAYIKNTVTLVSTNETLIPLTKNLGYGNITINNDGNIVIGKDISTIILSCQIYFYIGSANTKRIIVKKNGTNVVRSLATNGDTTSTYQISPTILSVKEGDVISIYVTGSADEQIYSRDTDSYITILKLN